MELNQYFQSYQEYFWEWITDEDIHDDSGYHENNLISIPNVGAIAYRPYVMEVLKELQPQGLPPFGALLLVLYATQEGYLNFDGLAYYLKKIEKKVNASLEVDTILQFLENLNRLGKSYKKGQNKIGLLQTLFKNSHNRIAPERAELLLKKFARKPHALSECADKIPLQALYVIRDTRILVWLNEKFPTTESIIGAMKGFIDEPELNDEVIEEETTIETGNDFIRELIDDPRTFQIGSLVKRIWSGLKIPMRHLSPGEQPIGGISDMTNKGEFHRMLLSEFANEDEVFMNRIANNETLYIQREIPPEENVFERIILIDTSLKNWGTPKVLAFASALAVIKHPKAHSACKVFTLGETATSVSLDKIEDVVEGLNLVSPVLDISQTLNKFFQEEHTEKDLEVFFITNQENLAHESLQRVIHENRDRLKFLVTTSPDGVLHFYKHYKGTRKHIQKIVLPLQELWANPPQRKQKTDHQSAHGKKTDVPKNYPILFPTPIKKIATFLYEGEFFILSNKRQLLRTYLSDNYYNKDYYDHYRIHRGCEVLIEDISVKPRGQFALARNKQQHFILCQYQQDKKLISKLNLDTKEYSELNLTGKNIPEDYKLVYFDKHFYLYHPEAAWIYEINIDGSLSFESVKNDKEIAKNDSKVGIEIDKLRDTGVRILNNFSNVGINSENDLVISSNRITRLHENSLTLVRNKYAIKTLASQYKNKFTFSDGSEVITDVRGMLTFISSNKNIPVFYIPSSEYELLSLATNTGFGGAEYYLPETTLLKMKKMEDMYSDCLEPFINQILEYGT
ncbi:hypothetical protein IQ37_04635 [Chryseobacterium piperi]|uniref:Uncharacterized protein n=1 Tax=Chryseobacterium piperi TaxID=558152 RepID=A0A086BL86_9FLAO|nr:hypothetical protein [Chryseobacterium piperi]ASW74663.1 hypothetical protein CJF12_10455 [Chryseobacterium piperi]KFF29700.1 hypothetical protein IQ37_04635 [Chryseobacterium piperi]